MPRCFKSEGDSHPMKRLARRVVCVLGATVVVLGCGPDLPERTPVAAESKGDPQLQPTEPPSGQTVPDNSGSDGKRGNDDGQTQVEDDPKERLPQGQDKRDRRTAPRADDLAQDPRSQEIREGLRRGLVSLESPGRFAPQGLVSREHFAAMIYSILDVFGVDPKAIQPTAAFDDVAPSRWSSRAIGVLDRLGVMGAIAPGTFAPEDKLTRAQAAVAVWALVKHGLHLRSGLPAQAPDVPEIVPRRSYVDLDGHWAEDRIVALSGFCRAEQGGEVPGRRFGADRASTRSHATGVLVRAMVCFETGQLPEWAKGRPDPSKAPVPDEEVLALCEPATLARREELLNVLADLPLGERDVDPAALGRSHEACVLGLLPGALATNLRTGVPASILVSQAVQETGWCRSKLALEGVNFHGQKAKFDQSYFRYWNGASIEIESSESPSGGGSKVRSSFMRFSHPDFSFYSVPERFLIPGLPYRSCMGRRHDAVAFIRCIGPSWAVHRDYANLVLEHRSQFRASSRPNLRLAQCDLKPEEWAVDGGF